jgi:hypothetical protein
MQGGKWSWRPPRRYYVQCRLAPPPPAQCTAPPVKLSSGCLRNRRKRMFCSVRNKAWEWTARYFEANADVASAARRA